MSAHIHRFLLSQPYRDSQDQLVTKAVCACGAEKVTPEKEYGPRFTRAFAVKR